VTAGSEFLHIYSTDCVVALKRALADSEAARGRCRGVIVGYLSARHRYNEAVLHGASSRQFTELNADYSVALDELRAAVEDAK
jgi:ribulose-5-phosphate 4-epimerase/fuculose-1-phosphate aldolase